MAKSPIRVKTPSCGLCSDRPYLETDMKVARPYSCGGIFATTILSSPIRQFMNIKYITIGALVLLFGAQTTFASIDQNLKYGQKHSSVIELQEFLIDKGFLNTQSTGFFGLLTLKAVQKYQTSVSVPSTGYVGVMTREQINKELSTLLTSSTQAEAQEVKQHVVQTTSVTPAVPVYTQPVVTQPAIPAQTTPNNDLNKPALVQDKFDLQISPNGVDIAGGILTMAAGDIREVKLNLYKNGLPTNQHGLDSKPYVKITSSNERYFPNKDVYLDREDKTMFTTDSYGTRTLLTFSTNWFNYGPLPGTPAGIYPVSISIPALNVNKILTIEVR